MSTAQSAQRLLRWSLSEFKSVENEVVEFSPLTVLVGANSSGKTTLIQSILLFAQAARHPFSGSGIPLGGELVGLEEFSTLHRIGAKDDCIGVGGVFHLESEYSLSQWTHALRAGLARHARRVPRIADAATPLTEVHWNIQLRGEHDIERPGTAQIDGIEFSFSTVHGTTDPVSVHFSARRVAGVAAGDRPVLEALSGRLTQADFIPVQGELRVSGHETILIAGVSQKAGLPLGLAVEEDSNRILVRDWLAYTNRSLARSAGTPVEIGARAHQLQFWQPAFGPLWSSNEPPPALETRVAQESETYSLACEQWAEASVPLLRSLAEMRGASRSSISILVDKPFVAEDSSLKLSAVVRMLGDPAQRQRWAQALYEKLGKGEPVWITSTPYPGMEEIENSASAIVRYLMKDVFYLGPLRQEPQVTYRATQPVLPHFIGTRGEHAAAVMHAFGQRKVLCPVLDEAATEVEKPLSDAVKYWIDRFGLGRDLSTRDRGRLGLELRILPGETKQAFDLTQVGTGVSQILPVIVLALLAPPRSLVLMEQPELHLHPAMQQHLADFLLACARSGRQLIIETHSDHFVSRLRRRVAEDGDDSTRDLIAFVFAEMRNGKTNYRRVKPTRYGSLEEWPEGFVDQTAKESQAILRAVAKKKAADSRIEK